MATKAPTNGRAGSTIVAATADPNMPTIRPLHRGHESAKVARKPPETITSLCM